MQKIVEAVNSNPDLPDFSRTTLYRLLKRKEFKFITRARNSALIDRPYIICWRQQYVRRIQQLRAEGRKIYYLDETWVNAGDCRKKLWVDTSVTCPRNAAKRGLSTGIPNPTGKGQRLIIAHIGSSDRFLPGALLKFVAKKGSGDYHQEMNGDRFLSWFQSFLPKLQDGSIIVMDNAPYHSVKVDRFPTMAWKKSDISKWLEEKGEVINSLFVKLELLLLAEKYKSAGTKYVIDEHAKEHGHTVVRLPPYHCELNPIEFAWAHVKNSTRGQNTTYKLADIEKLVDGAIENVSAEMRQNFIRHAMK
ncbi:uncharacterized protein LOC143211130 [Lasioglossum baleicum]|uniref:uncharacterized protein LOC143211130 n=1 Tax=Lasioglossum baleicum TaxID=434251 RepID=UPI003FCE09F5